MLVKLVYVCIYVSRSEPLIVMQVSKQAFPQDRTLALLLAVVSYSYERHYN